MRTTGFTRSNDRTEQEAQRRRARATQHLDRLRNRRSEPERKLPVPPIVGRIGALALALVFGAWVGDDALALGGHGWHVSAVEVQGASHLTGAEVARAAGIGLGDGYVAADPRRLAGSPGRCAGTPGSPRRAPRGCPAARWCCACASASRSR